MSINGFNNAGFSPAISGLSGVGRDAVTRSPDGAAMQVSWFSAQDSGSIPITPPSRATGYPDLESLASAILAKIAAPDA